MLEDVRFQAAIIAVVTGIVGGIIGTYLKHYLDRSFLRHRLETEYEYEERKKLRSLIGLHHGRILLAAEHLNHRLWNLHTNESKGWLHVNGQYTQDHYYFTTTAHRFVCLLALARHFQEESLYIDARFAQGNELAFLKFVKSLEWVMTDVALFKGLPYDDFHQHDHFFVDNLRLVCELCTPAGTPKSLDEFQAYIGESDQTSALYDFLGFFDGLCANENRLRWDRIVAFHLLLMAFINTFGYDMQKSTTSQFTEIAGAIKNHAVLRNLDDWLPKLGLDDQEETRHIASAVAAVSPKPPQPVSSTP